MIGLSYYAMWHGDLTALEANLTDLAPRYGRPLVVVETAYPWTVDNGDQLENFVTSAGQLPDADRFPPTPNGQAAYFEAVREVIARVPDGLGAGFIDWSPEWIPGVGWAPGEGNPNDNLTMFDWSQRAAVPGRLPRTSLRALRKRRCREQHQYKQRHRMAGAGPAPVWQTPASPTEGVNPCVPEQRSCSPRPRRSPPWPPPRWRWRHRRSRPAPSPTPVSSPASGRARPAGRSPVPPARPRARPVGAAAAPSWRTGRPRRTASRPIRCSRPDHRPVPAHRLGGHELSAAYIALRNCGGAEVRANIPASGGTWTQLSVTASVTTSQCRASIVSNANANNWINVDDVTFGPVGGPTTTTPPPTGLSSGASTCRA